MLKSFLVSQKLAATLYLNFECQRCCAYGLFPVVLTQISGFPKSMLLSIASPQPGWLIISPFLHALVCKLKSFCSFRSNFSLLTKKSHPQNQHICLTSLRHQIMSHLLMYWISSFETGPGALLVLQAGSWSIERIRDWPEVIAGICGRNENWTQVLQVFGLWTIGHPSPRYGLFLRTNTGLLLLAVEGAWRKQHTREP